MSSDIEALLLNEMKGVVKEVKADLQEFAPIEARFAEQLLVTATTIDTIGRTPHSILALFTKAPMNSFVEGKKVTSPTVDDLLARLGTKNARSVRNLVRDASIKGETAQVVAREIRKLAVNATRREIEATVLTSFNHFSNKAKQAVYSENSDILQGIKIVATLDSRTTPVCMMHDSDPTIWPLNSGPRPPFHYRCRSQAVPVVKEKFRLPITGRTRASELGPVDAQLTYDGFLRRMGKDRQKEILGPSRAKAFRAGLPVGKFVNDRGVKLTLKQLRRKFPDKF